MLAALTVLAAMSPGVAESTVTVFGEGTLTESTLTVEIYADVAPPTSTLRGFGVEVSYPAGDLSLTGASRDAAWSIGGQPYASPDTSVPGVASAVGCACDGTAGLSGDRVLLLTLTFDRIDLDPGFRPTLSLDYAKATPGAYVNFAEAGAGSLDGSVVFAPVTIAGPPAAIPVPVWTLPGIAASLVLLTLVGVRLARPRS